MRTRQENTAIQRETGEGGYQNGPLRGPEPELEHRHGPGDKRPAKEEDRDDQSREEARIKPYRERERDLRVQKKMYSTAKQEALEHPDGIDKNRDEKKTDYNGAGCRMPGRGYISRDGIRVFFHNITLLYRTGGFSSDV